MALVGLVIGEFEDTGEETTVLEGGIQIVNQTVIGADKPFTASYSSSTSWHLLHNRGRKPILTVFDTAGNEVSAAINHVSDNELYVNFTMPFAGSLSYF